MTDDARPGSHPNVIQLRPEQSGNMKVSLTHERLQRIKMRMVELKMDQAELAAATGLSASGISQIFKQKIKGTRHFGLFAKALKVNVGWLLGDTDQRVDLRDFNGEEFAEKNLPDLLKQFEFAAASVATIPTSEVYATEFDRRGNSVAVPEIDLTQRSKELISGIPVKAHRYMLGPTVLQIHAGVDPAHVMVAHGIGDAMQPALTNSDLVFIDISQRSIQTQDAVWLMRHAGMLTIRRVRVMPQGVHLMADNPVLQEYVVAPEELEVLGRVCGALRKF